MKMPSWKKHMAMESSLPNLAVFSKEFDAMCSWLNVFCILKAWLQLVLSSEEVYNLSDLFAGLDEFSLLSALCPLQHTTTAELAGSTTAASAGSELSKSENPF